MNSPNSSALNIGEREMAEIDPPSPWRPLVVPAIVVAILLAIAWALFAHFGRSKPDAAGSILKVQVYPVQVEPSSTVPEPGMAGAVAAQNEIVVLVQARVTNISKHPLSIFDMVADIDLDGDTNQSIAALPEDIDRLFQRFPDLTAMKMQPLVRHQVIQPGQSAEGLMVFNYAWTQQQWDKRKHPHIVISFLDGRSLELPLQ